VVLASAVSATIAWRLARRDRNGRPVAAAARALPSDRGRAGRPDKISIMWANIAADGGDTEAGLWGAMVINGSDSPIRHAHMTVRHRRDGWVSKEGFHKIAPHTRFKWSAVKVYANAGGGFGPSAVARPGQGRPLRIGRAWQEPTLFVLELTFQDTAGRFWLVTDDDELEEVSRDLTIWCDSERYTVTRQHIETEFQPKFGVDAKFEEFQTFAALVEETPDRRAPRRRADRPHAHRTTPDILMGPHDWLGRLRERRAIAEVSLAAHQRGAFEDMAIRALSEGGQLYGVPYSYDCVALLMNADLVGDTPPPATFQELLALGEEFRGPRGRAVAMQMGPGGDFYHMWPLLSSVGGTMAGLRADGTVQPRDEWQPAFVDAVAALIDLRRTAPTLLDPGLTRKAALALFLDGQTPYLIGACGRLGEVLDHQITIRTATVPPLGPYPAQSMVTVVAFYLTPYGENQRITQDLLTYYLARPDTSVELNRIQPWPPVQRDVASAVTSVRPELGAFIDAQRNGIVMPSHPRLGSAWDALHVVQFAVAGGDTDVKAIAGPAVAALHALDLFGQN
jgi:arabinogalactan oligomer / maltooligosaccharide transport system substrate-binding protein